MNKPIFLVGPSQVGKSSAANTLHDGGEVEHVDLDVELRRRTAIGSELIHTAQNWAVVGPLLDELDHDTGTRVVVVTIGAGTQDGDRARRDDRLEAWLLKRRKRVLLIDGNPNEVFARSIHSDRSTFNELEYGTSRQRIYRAAGSRISIGGLSETEAVDALRAGLRVLKPNSK